LFELKGQLMKKLKEEWRSILAAPFGTILVDGEIEGIMATLPAGAIVACVGDQTAYNLIQFGRVPDLAVVDEMAQRKPFDKQKSKLIQSHYTYVQSAANPAGAISQEAEGKILDGIKACADGIKVLLKIAGEEDLLFIPLLLAAPADSIIFYGQPDKGMVKCVASEENKSNLRKLVKDAFE
jgi:uncharacterized protein (UPF0218 family)